ncbi:MAG: glycosyltransferase family 2 protein [Armatimonadetes bacterium]|nr:glycosyltransferase family 2 protein [Armatimonadota bacterium]
MNVPRLAVLVPAYNEQARIVPTLKRLREYLSAQSYTWSVTVVSDGSKDETPNLVAAFCEENPGFSLIASNPNRGKGYVVRRGMLEVEAELLLFSDADLAAPIEEIEKLFPSIEQGADVAIGSRPLKESNLEIRQPLYRELLGRAFNMAVQLLAIRGIKDTQCGFKLFKRDVARDVFSRCKLEGFSFDFEALLIARDLGYKIAEVPIRWRHQEGSKVVLMRDGPRMIRDLIKLRLKGKKARMEISGEGQRAKGEGREGQRDEGTGGREGPGESEVRGPRSEA